MKSTLNLPANNQLRFDMFCNKDEHIFGQAKRCLPELRGTRCALPVDILTLLLKHYEKVLGILQVIKDNTIDILMPPEILITVVAI